MIKRFASFIFSSTLFAGVVVAQDIVRFVDQTATGSQSGLSWQNAHNDLQAGIDALLATPPPPSGMRRLLVAEGTYSPSTSFFPSNNGNPRRASILLPDAGDMALHGGFIGWNSGNPGSSDPNSPDGSFGLTVLSGDLGGGQFAYHVLALQGIDAFAPLIVDGFKVTGGLADGSSLDEEDSGAGAIIRGSTNLLFENVRFRGNVADFGGGGISVAFHIGSVSLRFCRITENHAEYGAGIHYPTGPQLNLANVHIHANGRIVAPPGGVVTRQGGGLWAGGQTNVDAANCLIYDNSARAKGGGLYWDPLDNTPISALRHHWKNCTITLNGVLGAGGGATSTAGAGIHIDPGGFVPGIQEQFFDLENCIVYGNRVGRDVTMRASSGLTGIRTTVSYSDVGTDFISPFIAPPGWFLYTNSTTLPTDNPFSVDPLFRDVPNRDLRLQVSLLGGVNSPCLDNGSDPLRGADVLDIDDDPLTLLLPLDYVKNPRLADVPGVVGSLAGSGLIDMGAYETVVDAVPSGL